MGERRDTRPPRELSEGILLGILYTFCDLHARRSSRHAADCLLPIHDGKCCLEGVRASLLRARLLGSEMRLRLLRQVREERPEDRISERKRLFG